MRNFIIDQLGAQGTHFDFLSGMTAQDLSGDSRLGPQRRKILAVRLEEGFNPGLTTWLGGICSIFTEDGEQIRTKRAGFRTVADFAQWLGAWYPRLDQIHDTVGIPPGNAKEVVYVVEDSIFGRRIAGWTGLPAEELTQVFRAIHETQGKRTIERWLRNYGYKGKVTVVYTSDLETELELALRIWERALVQPFPARKRDWAKVEMMYTPIWPSILGISKAIVAEPCHHGTKLPWGMFGNGLSQIGFLPYWGSAGTTRNLPFDTVPNQGNWREYAAWEPDWVNVNLEFNSRDPMSFPQEAMGNRASHLLREVYGDESR